MGANTKIEWCDFTFNCWRGCQKVAPGCANCYAESQSRRNPGVLGIWGPGGTRVVASESMWREPVKWNRAAEKTGERPRVFCGSMMDWAEDWSSFVRDSKGEEVFENAGGTWSTKSGEQHGKSIGLAAVRQRLFGLIDSTPHLDWLLLTKRPENIPALMPEYAFHACVTGDCPHELQVDCATSSQKKYRDNVGLGTSIACQADADRNIPLLLKCRDLSPVLFLSIEPLIGPVDLRCIGFNGFTLDCLTSTCCPWHPSACNRSGCNGVKVDWVIVGGESGPNARPCRVEWIRAIVRQCRDAGVPCFVKQLGANVVTRNDMIEDAFNGKDGWPDPQVEHHIHGFREDYQGADCRVRLRDSKGGDPAEWPEDLRVREIPTPSFVH